MGNFNDIQLENLRDDNQFTNLFNEKTVFSPRNPDSGGAEGFNLLSPSNIQILGANNKGGRESKLTGQKTSNEEPGTHNRQKTVGHQIKKMTSKNPADLQSLSTILEPTQGSQAGTDSSHPMRNLKNA